MGTEKTVIVDTNVWESALEKDMPRYYFEVPFWRHKREVALRLYNDYLVRPNPGPVDEGGEDVRDSPEVGGKQQPFAGAGSVLRPLGGVTFYFPAPLFGELCVRVGKNLPADRATAFYDIVKTKMGDGAILVQEAKAASILEELGAAAQSQWVPKPGLVDFAIKQAIESLPAVEEAFTWDAELERRLLQCGLADRVNKEYRELRRGDAPVVATAGAISPSEAEEALAAIHTFLPTRDWLVWDRQGTKRAVFPESEPVNALGSPSELLSAVEKKPRAPLLVVGPMDAWALYFTVAAAGHPEPRDVFWIPCCRTKRPAPSWRLVYIDPRNGTLPEQDCLDLPPQLPLARLDRVYATPGTKHLGELARTCNAMPEAVQKAVTRVLGWEHSSQQLNLVASCLGRKGQPLAAFRDFRQLQEPGVTQGEACLLIVGGISAEALSVALAFLETEKQARGSRKICWFWNPGHGEKTGSILWHFRREEWQGALVWVPARYEISSCGASAAD